MKNTKPIICIDTGEIFHTYKSYLKSKHWKVIRSKFKGSHCLFCNSNQIQVHHLSYKNIGKETEEDLIALCPKHHVKAHSIKKTGKRYHIKDSYLEFINNQWVIIKVYPAMFKKRKGQKRRRRS